MDRETRIRPVWELKTKDMGWAYGFIGNTTQGLRYWILDTRQLERDIGHGIPGFGNWNWALKAGHSVDLLVGRLEMNGPGQGTMG